MEAEAVLVSLLYVLMGLVILLGAISTLLFIWIKGILEETKIFLRIVIGIYENEENKKRRED